MYIWDLPDIYYGLEMCFLLLKGFQYNVFITYAIGISSMRCPGRLKVTLAGKFVDLPQRYETNTQVRKTKYMYM